MCNIFFPARIQQILADYAQIRRFGSRVIPRGLHGQQLICGICGKFCRTISGFFSADRVNNQKKMPLHFIEEAQGFKKSTHTKR